MLTLPTNHLPLSRGILFHAARRYLTESRLIFQFRGGINIVLAVLVLLVSSCSAKTGIVVLSPEEGEQHAGCVVLIHGMGRSSRAMKSMQETLVRHGYDTVNLGYDSTKKDIESIALEDYSLAVERCLAFSPDSIHFVTHSLGGIVLRKALSEKKPEKLGRVVMLSPPNQGSKLVDRIKNWRLYRWMTGPAGQQLISGADGLPANLGKADFPLGIITGNRHAFFDSWFASIIPGTDDGKVSIESAQLDGMNDFLITGDSHPFIMNSTYVQKETIHFLQHGKFKHDRVSSKTQHGQDWYSEKN